MSLNSLEYSIEAMSKCMTFLLPMVVLLVAGCTHTRQPTNEYSIESRAKTNAEIDKLTLYLSKAKWPAYLSAARDSRGKFYSQANRPEEAMEDIMVADRISGNNTEKGVIALLSEELSEPENTLSNLK